MFRLIDSLSSAWLNWRVSRVAKKSGQSPVSIRQFSFKDGDFEMLAHHEMLATFADSMAELLVKSDAPNYVSFDVWGRSVLKHAGRRPIRITLQWAHRESPESAARKLREACEEIVRAANGGADATELRSIAALALALCGYDVPREKEGDDGERSTQAHTGLH